MCVLVADATRIATRLYPPDFPNMCTTGEKAARSPIRRQPGHEQTEEASVPRSYHPLPAPPAVNEGEFPVLYLAYPERGGGFDLHLAMRRWGLEAKGMDTSWGEDVGEEEEEDKEGYRVHAVEVRLKKGDR